MHMSFMDNIKKNLLRAYGLFVCTIFPNTLSGAPEFHCASQDLHKWQQLSFLFFPPEIMFAKQETMAQNIFIGKATHAATNF